MSDSLWTRHQRGVFEGKLNHIIARSLTFYEVFIIISIYCLDVNDVRREFQIGVIFRPFSLSSQLLLKFLFVFLRQILKFHLLKRGIFGDVGGTVDHFLFFLLLLY